MSEVTFSITDSLSMIIGLSFYLFISPCLLKGVIRIRLGRHFNFLSFFSNFLWWGFCGYRSCRDQSWSCVCCGLDNLLQIMLGDMVNQIGFSDVAFRSCRCYRLSFDAIIQKVEPGRWRHFWCCLSWKHTLGDCWNHFCELLLKSKCTSANAKIVLISQIF